MGKCNLFALSNFVPPVLDLSKSGPQSYSLGQDESTPEKKKTFMGPFRIGTEIRGQTQYMRRKSSAHDSPNSAVGLRCR